jgi:hypothetical protein
MPAALLNSGRARKQMLDALWTAAEGYLSIHDSLWRSYLGKRIFTQPTPVIGGTDVFIPTLARLYNGLTDTEKTYLQKDDVTACLNALRCFTEFLDCGKKTGRDASFADIYAKNPKWKKKWVAALALMVVYIECCKTEHPENMKVLLAQYDWAGMTGKVTEANTSVPATTSVRAYWASKWPRMTRRTEELPDAHVLESMRGLLDAL